MSTSNKWLLGALLTLIITLSLIHVALYAKYKNGDFTTLQKIEQDQYRQIPLTAIRYVVARGMANVVIVSSESANLEMYKSDSGHFTYQINGDTLFLEDNIKPSNTNDGSKEERFEGTVKLYLPATVTVSSNRSAIYLDGELDSAKARSYQFNLENNSHFEIRENDQKDGVFRYLKELKVQASDNSSILLNRLTCIKNAHIRLADAEFDDERANIETFSISCDSSSVIRLNGDNFLKANTVKSGSF